MRIKQMKSSGSAGKMIEKTRQRLCQAPPIACRIYEFAESLFWRDETAERMTLTDIARIHEFLRETENDGKRIKKQFQELLEIEDGFSPEEFGENIPTGF